MKTYKSPLIIYLIWHPSYVAGIEIGKQLFSTFCKDVEFPLDHRLGIPVYFRSAISGSGKPIDIILEEADRTVIVCLIDDNLILDQSFKDYVIQSYAKCSSTTTTKFIPVALCKAAYKLDTEIGRLNYIKASTDVLQPDETIVDVVYHNLLHELCKVFIENEDSKQSVPVKLFISHSKHDESLNDAVEFRNYINSSTQLKTFFDANDIGFGDDFANVIEHNAGKCIVVAFMSDTFSTREWCKSEIIIAKKNHCPIVVVNAVIAGERRSFPYMGNVPTKRWNGDIKAIVNLALITSLNSFYTKESLIKQTDLFEVEADFTLSTYPELFSIIGIKQEMIRSQKDAAVIIYPDPPLGNEEIKLLNQMDERLSFITPLQLSTFLSYDY